MMDPLIFSKHPAAVAPAAVTNSFPDFPYTPKPWIDNDEDFDDE